MPVAQANTVVTTGPQHARWPWALAAVVFAGCSLAATVTAASATLLSAELSAATSPNVFTLFDGSVSVVDAQAAVSSPNDIYTFTSAPGIQWYLPVQNATLLDLPALFQVLFSNDTRYTEFGLVSPSGIYLVADNDNKPFVIYFATGETGDEAFTCSPTTRMGPGPITCTYVNTTSPLQPIQVDQIELSSNTPTWAVHASIDASASNTSTNNVLAILCSRLSGIALLTDSYQTQMLPNNQGRRHVGYQVSAGGAFMGIVGMLAHIGLTSVLLSWVAPVFSESLARWTDDRILHSPATDSWVWFTILFFLTLFTALGGGLPAWAFMALLYAATEVGIIIAYIVIRVVQRRSASSDDIELVASKSASSVPRWTQRPDAMGKMQSIYLWICTAFIVTCVVVIIIIAGAWGVQDYYVLDRQSFSPTVEIQPMSVSKSTLAIYSITGAAQALRMNFFLNLFTNYCGYSYNVALSDYDKYHILYMEYIYSYNVDMSQFVPSNYTEYDTINQWFIRSLKPGSRVIDSYDNDDIIVSGADSRIFVFTQIPTDFKLTVKEEDFDVPTLLNNNTLGAMYNNGSMVIFRLAPQDYHRFHTPVSGVVQSISDIIAGTIFSVNADAVRSDNAVYYNKRQIMVISTPNVGLVTLVIVGATCVGSIVVTSTVGATIKKGDEIGYFQYGGSTILALFQANTIQADPDLLYSTSYDIETLVNMGTRIAQKS